MTNDEHLRAFAAAVRRGAPGSLEEGDQLAILPRNQREVAAVLRIASEHRVSLAAPGSGLSDDPNRVVLDLRRLDEIICYDDTSLLVHVGAGCTLTSLANSLEKRGWSLRLPTAVHAQSVGEWLARGAIGSRASQDDPVEQLVAGLTFVTASGEVVTIRPAPRRAVGPDLATAVIGARARLGVITAAWLSASLDRPLTHVAILFPTLASANASLGELRRVGVRAVRSEVSRAAEGGRVDWWLERTGEVDIVTSVSEQHQGVWIEGQVSHVPCAPAAPSPIVEALARDLDPHRVLC